MTEQEFHGVMIIAAIVLPILVLAWLENDFRERKRIRNGRIEAQRQRDRFIEKIQRGEL